MPCLHVGHNYCQDVLILSQYSGVVIAPGIASTAADLGLRFWRDDPRRTTPAPYGQRVLETGLYCACSTETAVRQRAIEASLYPDR